MGGFEPERQPEPESTRRKISNPIRQTVKSSQAVKLSDTHVLPEPISNFKDWGGVFHCPGKTKIPPKFTAPIASSNTRVLPEPISNLKDRGGAFHCEGTKIPPISTAPVARAVHSSQPQTQAFQKHKSSRISTPVGRNELPLAIPELQEPGPPEQSEICHSPFEQSHGRFLQSGSAESGNTDRVIEALCGQLALNRLPVLEPGVFNGKDPLSFPIWQMAFEGMINYRAMTAADKLNLLNRYVDGEAKLAIRGFLLLPPPEAFRKAYAVLVRRYGDNFRLAKAFRDRLKSWVRVGETDAAGLRNFVDFLTQCESAKNSLHALKILDDEFENAEMCKKLPAWLSRKWTRRVAAHREATGEYPPFKEFVEFITQARLYF